MIEQTNDYSKSIIRLKNTWKLKNFNVILACKSKAINIVSFNNMLMKMSREKMFWGG